MCLRYSEQGETKGCSLGRATLYSYRQGWKEVVF